MKENIPQFVSDSEILDENTSIPNSEKSISDIISVLKEKFPSIERTIHTANGWIKLFSVIAIIGSSAEAGAQIVKDNTSDLEKSKIVAELDSLPLNQIMKSLDGFKLHFPEGQKILVSSHKERKNDKSTMDETIGQLPDDKVSIGNVGVLSSERFINKNTQNRNKETHLQEQFESLSSISVDITYPTDKDSIEGTGQTIKTVYTGDTKEDAIIGAIKELSEQERANWSYIERDVTSTKDTDINEVMIEVFAGDALNYLKNVRVISVKKIKGSFKDTYFEATVEAERAHIVDKVAP